MKPMKKEKLKIFLAMISLHIVGLCAIYGILKFNDWAESINPIFGYIASLIVALSFIYCYYLFFKMLEYMSDEAEDDL